MAIPKLLNYLLVHFYPWILLITANNTLVEIEEITQENEGIIDIMKGKTGKLLRMD